MYAYICIKFKKTYWVNVTISQTPKKAQLSFFSRYGRGKGVFRKQRPLRTLMQSKDSEFKIQSDLIGISENTV